MLMYLFVGHASSRLLSLIGVTGFTEQYYGNYFYVTSSMHMNSVFYIYFCAIMEQAYVIFVLWCYNEYLVVVGLHVPDFSIINEWTFSCRLY